MFVRRPRSVSLTCAAFALLFALRSPVYGQEAEENESIFAKLNFFRPFDPSKPVTVAELSHRLDHIVEEMRDDGLVIIKQPDTFSQARMTRFRTDFESQMSTDLANFHLVLAARINRLDAATTTSQTALSGALAGPGQTNVTAINSPPALPTLPTSTATGTGLGLTGGPFNSTTPGGLGLAANNMTTNGALSLGVEPTVYLDEKKRFLDELNEIRRISLGPDQNDSSGYGLYLIRMPISITPGEKTYHGFGADVSVAVEHEFPPQFLPTTFKNLVINDIVDQLGPAVYEVLRSSDLYTTLQNYHSGQKENAYFFHQIIKLVNSRYLKSVVDSNKSKAYSEIFKEKLADFILRDANTFTFNSNKKDIRNLAIKARLDALVVYLGKWDKALADQNVAGNIEPRCKIRQIAGEVIKYAEAEELNPIPARDTVKQVLQLFLDHLREPSKLIGEANNVKQCANGIQPFSEYEDDMARFIVRMYDESLPDDICILDNLFVLRADDKKTVTNRYAISNDSQFGLWLQLSSSHGLTFASTRSAKQDYPIDPREILSFFGLENILYIAQDVKQSLRTPQPRLLDIRGYLRHTLEAAYSVMAHSPTHGSTPGETYYERIRYGGTTAEAPLCDGQLLDDILKHIQRRFYARELGNGNELTDYNRELLSRISKNRVKVTGTPTGALCWAIALDAAILDHALREDARKVFETKKMPTDMIDSVRFYHPKEGQGSMPEGSTAMARAVFNDYVKARWPVVTFSLDPVTDQQNIADSFNLKRDLQLAVSFAFATGQIGFNQLNTFRRQIEQSSDTIALNKTVTGFIHGNDMFGFRFTPRFQNPPNQRHEYRRDRQPVDRRWSRARLSNQEVEA